jgi:hypothetical protein
VELDGDEARSRVSGSHKSLSYRAEALELYSAKDRKELLSLKDLRMLHSHATPVSIFLALRRGQAMLFNSHER